MIKLSNITLNFGQNTVFDNLSVDIELGSKCCISGPSGKGKSSVLKIIQGFLIPQSGDVYVNQLKLSDKTISSIRELISWVPQNIDLPVESGEELSRLLKMSRKDEEKILENIEKVGLDKSFYTRSFKEISGGQKQRIVLSVCTARQKPILMLDEPTSSLDEGSVDLVVEMINSLSDVTVLSTSHNENWIRKATKVIKL